MTDEITPPSSPVRLIPGDDKNEPQDEIVLCLSGGGYRAMVFHLGALLGSTTRIPAEALARLARLRRVDHGGILGLKWNRLMFDPVTGISPLQDEVVAPVLNMASTTFDAGDILKGLFLPGTIADYVVRSYRKLLFGKSHAPRSTWRIQRTG